MKLIVFSSSDRSLSEAKEVTELFDAGLEYFHIRKGKMDAAEMEEYIRLIPEHYHKKIIIHSNHNLRKVFDLGGLHFSRTHRRKKYNKWWKKLMIRIATKKMLHTRNFSKISDLADNKEYYSYVFLSPIYQNISKIGHSGNFGKRSIKKFVGLSKIEVIALGGITPTKFEECRELNFSGVALLGYIWQNRDLSPLEAFLKAQDKLLGVEEEITSQ